MYAKGTEVYYLHFHGYVNFSDRKYVTITIQYGEHRSQDVNIVVKGSELSKIRLAKESDK